MPENARRRRGGGGGGHNARATNGLNMSHIHCTVVASRAGAGAGGAATQSGRKFSLRRRTKDKKRLSASSAVVEHGTRGKGCVSSAPGHATRPPLSPDLQDVAWSANSQEREERGGVADSLHKGGGRGPNAGENHVLPPHKRDTREARVRQARATVSSVTSEPVSCQFVCGRIKFLNISIGERNLRVRC